MSIKFAVVFLAFFAYQGVFASPAEVLTFGIGEQIEKALEKLKIVIQVSIDKAVEDLNNVLGKIEEKGEELIELIKINIDQVVGEAGKQIQKLVEDAHELSVDVKECVKDSDEDLEKLVKGLLESAVKCVTDKVNEATGIIVEAIEEVKNYVNIIGGLDEDVKMCGTGFRAIRCLGEVLADVTKATINLPVEISKKVTEITALVSGLEAAMIQCATNIGIDATGQAGSIVIDVGECVADNIKDSQ
ncbi:PREDICTED: uncharacterized protein LOC108556531 [Nicrophorus vespilloides]|uniref:Uncharacterized protein LOC108556531 n=1 Tax=Nicrophorus vespilloides TaxID=110193 RepID=A0ABM1M0S1_NICVS|nr:PREDICTED: uncharacterized protein LOC108556531 [Nicrophorus vespilloides]